MDPAQTLAPEMSSTTSASFSTGQPSKPLPSITEFQTWHSKKVLEFLEPYIAGFEKNARDIFVDNQYDGETLAKMTHQDLVVDGLPKGPSRKIMRVVNEILQSGNSNLKRQREKSAVQEELPQPKRHRREGLMVAELRGEMEEVTTPTKPIYEAYRTLIKEANKLAEDIETVSYDLEDFYRFGDELLELPFPFVGKPPRPRFTILPTHKVKGAGGITTGDGQPEDCETRWFRYYGRESFKVIFDDVMSLRIRDDFSMYYIHGTLGYGKSYMLAALVIVLITRKKKVVYLPDCRQLVRDFLAYLKNALVLTYAGDLETQCELLKYTRGQALVRWCTLRATSVGERLYFVIDQLNALDTGSESLDSVSVQERQQCAKLIAILEGSHYLIYSSSGNYKHGLHEQNGSGALRRSFFGGLSETEIEKWWSVFGPTMGTKVLNHQRKSAESLTGRIPILLQALVEIQVQEPQLDDDERWEKLMEMFLETGPVAAMRRNIAQYYSQTRMRLEATHSGTWIQYLEMCHACVSARPTPLVSVPDMLDWRYFFHKNDIADSSCLLARQYLTYCMRVDVSMTNFQTDGWRNAMAAASPLNPSVLGFFTEQVLLGEIARSGISALGKGWEVKMTFQALTGSIPTLPREAKECAVMYVPTKPTFKGIDALFFRLVSEPGNRGNFKAIVVPTQITIAESHSDSEAAFFSTWPQYHVALKTLGFIASIEIAFLWIVERVPAGHQPKETVPKGTRTLKGNRTHHPAFVRQWMLVDEAGIAVGDLLKAARGRSNVANVPVVLPPSSPVPAPVAPIATAAVTTSPTSTSGFVAPRRSGRAAAIAQASTLSAATALAVGYGRGGKAKK